ncbi:fungal-specific transcription factor domain-containing protein [Calycina marina]|uniref:Fungal-specific transcription factor domain-containing protein n=1 Tax=Calycina marina TaxID=1763456 RepID=A0A9P7YXM4_9HELO|nr:fungal-specific transcription factor domain-containing protein [Calycina marina]
MQPTTKNRRSRRTGRTYTCMIENCQKVYSRAEHLSRHQLNHDPKQIYNCDVPNCCCSFVRFDLYNLHRTRHMNEYLEDSVRSVPVSLDHTGTMQYTESLNTLFAQGSQAGSPQQLYTNSNQTNTEDILTSLILTSNNQPANPFPVQETAAPVSMPLNHRNQDSELSHPEHAQETEQQKIKLQPPPTIPLFDSDSYALPPFAIPDDFIQFLFDETQFINAQNGDASHMGSFTNYAYIDNQDSQGLDTNCISNCYLSQPQINSFIVPCGADSTTRSLSHEKSEEVFVFIQHRLIRVENSAVSDTMIGASLLEGDRSQDQHVLSRNMMQYYIENYWRSFHDQFPILHWASFSPNTAPNILLISIMIIGASCSVELDEPAVASSSVEFSKVLAWHLRWEIFRSIHMESDSLWIYQALLHLELYEKTYSSRSLHERSHIHHATTINMMRRGSFLAGNSLLDSSPTYEEQSTEKRDDESTASIGDIWWEDWIKREGTRRLAFAAFVIDSLHASMFGHSIAMATHEIRLALPCDDSLWLATNGNEVRRIEATLRSNSVRPIPFLEGLRSTLNGQVVRTNSFGASILLCGVLSVSWHMNQRDIQLSSLGMCSQRTERGTKWRRSLSRAIDLWRDSHGSSTLTPREDVWQNSSSVLGSRSALYYLAQFSPNVDIVDCQIFAGATRVLGRHIGAQDVDNVQQRIRKIWAPSVEARKATFYAIRFLCLVFREAKDSLQGCDRESVVGYSRTTSKFPVHRWVLYSAALVVWSYTYAVDGPSRLMIPAGSSLEDHIREMDRFLIRAETIKSPEDVAFYRLNGCAGMLHVLCFIFQTGTWELLLEGASLLENCIRLIENVG